MPVEIAAVRPSWTLCDEAISELLSDSHDDHDDIARQGYRAMTSRGEVERRRAVVVIA